MQNIIKKTVINNNSNNNNYNKNKKEEKIKEKECYKNTVKKQKESIRQALLSAEIDKRNEMEQKKKKI